MILIRSWCQTTWWKLYFVTLFLATRIGHLKSIRKTTDNHKKSNKLFWILLLVINTFIDKSYRNSMNSSLWKCFDHAKIDFESIRSWNYRCKTKEKENLDFVFFFYNRFLQKPNQCHDMKQIPSESLQKRNSRRRWNDLFIEYTN